MKRTLLCLLTATLTGWTAQAQLSEGGIPLSLRSEVKDQYIPSFAAALPDWASALRKSEAMEAAGKPQPYLVALFTATQVSFPASGTFAKSGNGHQVWRTQVTVDGAKAIGLYYNTFHLPEGVQLFVSNTGSNQILGAYTSKNNSPSGTFVNEAVQGNTAMLELDIAPGVNLDDIQMNINRAAVYFRGVEYLIQYAADFSGLHEIDGVDSALAGRSSVCMINAICPEGAGYPNQRKATFQTLIPVGQGVGACSATMINNTGNTGGTCKQYFLLATHCDGANNSTSAGFDQVILRYNFAQANCASGTTIPVSNTMTGANFIARANYSESAPISNIKGDFLLLEARQAVPASWGVVLAGWNKDPNLATTATLPKKFIGFHHPDADVKKVSATQNIEGTSLDGTTVNATHWGLETTEGLVSTGSSGSGLFDGDGYLIGIASVAGPDGLSPACTLTAAGQPATGTANFVAYSKFAYDWDYTIDGTGNNRKLKPWLDPANTGVVKLGPVKSNCSAVDGGTGITQNATSLDNAITVYPNPSVTGLVQVKLNLAAAADITMELYDVTGKKVNTYTLNKVRNGAYTIDLSAFSNGMYLLKCSNGSAAVSKKIMLSK